MLPHLLFSHHVRNTALNLLFITFFSAGLFSVLFPYTLPNAIIAWSQENCAFFKFSAGYCRCRWYFKYSMKQNRTEHGTIGCWLLNMMLAGYYYYRVIKVVWKTRIYVCMYSLSYVVIIKGVVSCPLMDVNVICF